MSCREGASATVGAPCHQAGHCTNVNPSSSPSTPSDARDRLGALLPFTGVSPHRPGQPDVELLRPDIPSVLACCMGDMHDWPIEEKRCLAPSHHAGRESVLRGHPPAPLPRLDWQHRNQAGSHQP